MALFDILDDVAQKQVTKTDTGDNRIFGVVVGTVTKNYESSMPGRVCVSIPTRDKEANELKWARVAYMSGGSKWGHYFLPEVGDQVLLVFEGGNIERPYIIGCVMKDNSEFLKENKNEKNAKKAIQTKNGTHIIFEDGESEEGDSDKFTVETGGQKFYFCIDNKGNTIEMGDKDKKNTITISATKGAVSVKAEKLFEVNVGDQVKLTMNGQSGTMLLEENKFKVNSGGTVEISGSQKSEIKGSAIEVSAGTSLKLSSGGMATLEGSPTKVGS